MVGSPQGVARQGHATVETEMQADETDPWTTMGGWRKGGSYPRITIEWRKR